MTETAPPEASKPLEGGPRRAVTWAVFGLLIAGALLALVMLLVPKQRIAATNNITTGAFGLALHTPDKGEVCLEGQNVPQVTGGVRMLLGTYGADGEVRVRVLDGKEVVSSGKVYVTDPKEKTTVPLSALPANLAGARVCIASDVKIAIAGDPAGGPPQGVYSVGGKPMGKSIHVDYMREGKQSLAQMLPTIFTRAALWAPGWVGAWTFWLFFILLPLTALFACWQMVRLLRGDVPPTSGKWLRLAIGVAFINAFAWSFFSPQLMGPDEVGHYAYTQTLVQNHDLPSRVPNGGEYGSYGNHQALAVNVAIRNVLGNFDGRMPWDRAAYDDWNSQDSRLPDLGKKQGGGWTSAAAYSPLYYAGAAVPYQVTSGSTIWTQNWAMRLFSVLLSLLTVWFCFLFARELLPTVPWAAPIAGLVVAFEPMFVHIGSTVNNDSLLFMSTSALMYVLARILRRGITWGNAAAAGLLMGIGLLAKPTMLAFVPVAAFVFGYAIVAGGGAQALATRATRLAAAAVAAAVGVIVLLPYYATLGKGDSSLAAASGVNPNGGDDSIVRFVSYIWQWYFPRLPGMPFVDTTQSLPVLSVYLRGFLANFNSLDTYFADAWYLPATIVLLLLLGGAAAWGWQERARLKEWWPQATLCLLSVAALLLLINLRSWQQLLFDGKPFAQGRYLLPLIGLFAVGVVAGAQGYKRWAPALAGFAVAGLALMNLFGYAATLTRYFV